MTADRVIVLVLIVVGLAFAAWFNQRRLSRMTPAERERVEHQSASVTGTLVGFMWVWAVLVLGAAGYAAFEGVWPMSVAFLLAGVAIGLTAWRNGWWTGRS